MCPLGHSHLFAGEGETLLEFLHQQREAVTEPGSGTGQ